MIYIDRSNTAVPGDLDYKNGKSSVARYTREKVAALTAYYQGKGGYGQVDVDDSYDYIFRQGELRDQLYNLFNSKCAICESRIAPSDALGDIRRFRPSKNAMNLDGKVSREHYWWLAFDWSNFYMICLDCSNSRGNRFPVQGKRARPNNPKERPLIIDPCNKADFSYAPFTFKENGSIHGLNRYAVRTIHVFNLNRESLMKARRVAMDTVKFHSEALSSSNLDKKKLAQHTKSLKALFGPFEPYLAAKAAMVKEVEKDAARARRKEKDLPEGGAIESTGSSRATTSRGTAKRKTKIATTKRKKDKREAATRGTAKRRPTRSGAARRKSAKKTISKKSPIRKSAGQKGIASSSEAYFEGFNTRASDIILAQNMQIRESLSDAYFDQNAPVDFTQAELVEPAYAQVKYKNLNFESAVEKESYFSSVKKIRKIEINNFKIIKSLTLDFPTAVDKNEPWLVLLGENGSGKSSVLQALAFTLMGSIKVNQLGRNAAKYVNRNTGATSGFVKVYLTGIDEPVELTFSKKSERFESNYEEPIVLMQAFGSTRLMSKEPERQSDESLANVKNLFDHYYALPNIENWLGDRTKVKKVLFDEIATELKKLLLLPPERDIKRRKIKEGEFGLFLKLHADRKEERLLDLSAGYQAVIILSVTIMREMLKVWDHFKLAEGIVLIDEIGVHMHPRWKLQIVNNLRTIFPNLTFVITTHEPLCLRGVKKGEVLKMRADDENNVMALPISISPDSLTIDQMMTSSLFGLLTSYEPGVELKMNTYYFLKAKDKLNTKEKSQFKELEKELTELNVIGGNTVLEKTEHFVKEAFKEQVYSATHDSDKVDAKVKSRLAGLFKKK